ncbi:MAG: 50S ribosomal protein L9 [Rhodospirillales bacterium]
MDVILLERIEHLGQMGDVVHVKPGYARNYLLPRGKAARATEENRKRFEAQRAQLEATNLQRRSEAEVVAGKLDGISVSLIRQAGESGQLYGSVAARDIATAVTEAGFTVARDQIRLKQPIKTLGLHRVQVSLHPEVFVTVVVNVARSSEEAGVQLRTGGAVTSSTEIEEDEAETEATWEEEIEVAIEETDDENATKTGGA